jgi:hypothetical protein
MNDHTLNTYFKGKYMVVFLIPPSPHGLYSSVTDPLFFVAEADRRCENVDGNSSRVWWHRWCALRLLVAYTWLICADCVHVSADSCYSVLVYVFSFFRNIRCNPVRCDTDISIIGRSGCWNSNEFCNEKNMLDQDAPTCIFSRAKKSLPIGTKVQETPPGTIFEKQ